MSIYPVPVCILKVLANPSSKEVLLSAIFNAVVTVNVPLCVSAASDLRKDAEEIPSKVSASKPEPAPSTVLIFVSTSAAV